MVKQYEVDKKNDGGLQPEQNIPQLIRVEEGAILFRRDSPGARSARSGKIGHGFRRQKVNADDSSAFSAYSQISHVSSMGIVSLEEEMELDSKPSGTRPSPLGGRDKDESDVTTRPAGENLSDTLDKAPLNSCYFRDGQRQIDFILAYRLDCSGGQAESKRRIYESNLRDRGLELEHESAEHSSDNNTYFVKVHCPFDVLCDGAEFMNLKMPFKEEERTHSSWLDHLVPTCVRNSFASPLDPLPQVYTTTFDKNKLHKMEHYYVGGSNHETLFNSSQRIQIVSGILLRTPHTPPDERVKIGIQRLLDTDVYISAFPLHDSTLVEPEEEEDDLDPEPRPESDRQKLYRGWGRFAMWKNAQPLDHIRRYFGEKVSLYFCWLGFYTAWLIVPSIVGVVCFLYGIITYNQNEIADGICANKKDFLMCPRCDSCHFEILDCKGVRVSHLFDNNFTVAFSVFMSIWARLFLEFWKREQSSKAFEWDTLGFEGQDEPPRPQYEQKATETEVNPVTMKTEPSIPNTARYPRLASAFMVSLFMISLVIAAVIGVIVYRLAIRGILAKTSLSDDIAVSSIIVSGAGALANFLFILFMSTVYYKLAHFLTDWEMHRTQTEYEDALSFKMYMFQFVNFYSSIFYIAFVQGRFNGTPPNYNRLLGYRQEECGSYGCLLDLCIQLFVIMVGKQTIGNFLELGVPRLKVWLKSKSGDDDMNNFPNWDQEFQLEPWPEDGLFDEYLEMVIQYGFITIFVACFPLAPVFALVNNIIEIRLDGNKILCSTRRCVPDRAEDIGIWYDILERVSTLAVICNACIIAFTSEFIPRLVYMYTINSDLTNYANYTLGTCDIDLLNLTKTVLDSRTAIEMGNATHCRYRMHFSTDPANPAIWMQVTAARLGFIIVFEHFVFFITGLVDFMIPDIPDHVQTAIEREKYLGKEALRAREASPLPFREETIDWANTQLQFSTGRVYIGDRLFQLIKLFRRSTGKKE
ncbi:anoctamin-7-like isoform X3 [Bolinopsis microptera]|uniref:anoctamin-7-like isoform X3 n=1 Tax=Bolinopsis microptera TaxID=2820187 RepID=UPI00307952C3